MPYPVAAVRNKSFVAPSVVYLLRDEFTTTEAAPLASPRTCEPGPGTLTLVQTDGEFSISGEKLSFPAQSTPAWGDQGLYGAGLARTAGRAVIGLSSFSTRGVSFPVAWSTAATINFGGLANLAHAFYVGDASGTLYATVGATNVNLGILLSGTTDYRLTLVPRGTGAFYAIKGGAFTEWTLAWVAASGSTATLYPAMSNYSGAGTLDYIRVTNLGAPWNDDYGIATQRLAGARNAGDTFTHEANCVIEWVVTSVPSSGYVDVAFRYVDTTHHWFVRVDSTGSLILVEYNGSTTVRATAVGVVANGDRIVMVADGTVIKVYESNTLRLNYSSATNFQSETGGRLVQLGTGGACSDIVAWPRTLSGTALSELNRV